MQLRSHEQTVKKVLNSHYFYVPRFQRPYSWTKENVDELWEDIVNADASEYFIGSMVVYPYPNSDKTAVIDGQQRLTTLLMLLSAIRDVADEHGISDVGNGTHRFVERENEDDQPQFVLTSESSYPFLQDQVFSRGAAELETTIGKEEQRIHDAYERLLGHVSSEVEGILSKGPKSSAKARIKSRLKLVRDRVLSLNLILIQVGNRDDATTIFVTLNSRGRDLAPSDLVKAQLLQLLPAKSGLDRPLVKWDSITTLFDESEADLDMSDFLRISWISQYEQVSRATLAKKVRTSIKKAQAARYLDTVCVDAKHFRVIHEPDFRKWNANERGAKASLEYFRDLEIRLPMPLLLSLMRAYDDRAMTLGSFRKALRAIEDYHFTWTTLANRSSSGGMSFFYGKWARDLLHAPSKSARGDAVAKLIDELREKRPSRAEFDEAIHALRVTTTSTADRKKVQYLLRRLYEIHAPTAALDLTLTIEHLKPQSDGQEVVGSIGNLILVTTELNAELGNLKFAKKKPLLQAADEWIPKDVLDAKRWGSRAITSRTSRLVDEAADLFSVPESTAGEDD